MKKKVLFVEPFLHLPEILLIPLDSDCEICSAIKHPFIRPVCPDYCWLMGNGIPVYKKGKRQGADADTASIPS